MTARATDVSAQAALLDNQRRVLERIATGAPLPATLELLVTLIEAQAQGMRCAVLLADSLEERLEFVAAPTIPGDYKRGMKPFLRIGPDMGSCGTAAFLRKPVYTRDTAADPLWKECRDIAVRNGLRAIWSTPIVADDNAVLGTFAMYYDEPRLPSLEQIQLIDMAVQMARVAIEAKRAEDALRRTEDRLRLVIDTIPTMAWRVLPDGRLDLVNQRWLDYTGLSLEEALKNPNHAVHREDLPGAVEKWMAAMASGEPFESELRLRRADGEYRRFLIRTVPLRDEQRNIINWYGTSTDIEDRKRAEDALRRSEDSLRRVIDTVPAIVWSALPDGDVDFVNDRWLEYTGLPRASALEWRWTSIIHPDDLTRTAEYWRAVLSAGEPAEIEQRFRRADGEYRWHLSRHVPVRDDMGRIVRWYGMCTDIQDRREAEDTLRRNQAFFVSEAQRIGRLLGTPASQDDGTIAGQRATGAAGKTNAGERKLAAEHHVLETLTSHERAIIRLITQGKSNAEVGEALHLSPRTVEAYRARLMQKLHLDDVTALVKFAIRHGLASVE